MSLCKNKLIKKLPGEIMLEVEIMQTAAEDIFHYSQDPVPNGKSSVDA